MPACMTETPIRAVRVGGADGEGFIARLTVRETLMGAQDNLTNVLAVVLGVAVGSGRADFVALAGFAAALAEAISMGGVLYTATRADLDLDARAAEAAAPQRLLSRPPLLPPQAAAVPLGGAPPGIVSLVVSVWALFVLGSWKGRVTGRSWRRDGLQLVAIAGLAALAAALIGIVLRVS